MFRIVLAALLMISPIAVEGWSRSAEAQTTAPAGSFLETLRLSVVEKTGAPDADIKISVVGSLIVLERVNAAAEKTSHESRTREAAFIASVIAAGIAGKEPYAKIISINVLYFRQHGKLVGKRPYDKLEFRQSPAGVFELHMT